MSPTTRTIHGISVREVFSWLDEPERPRDLDIEGELDATLQRDSQEYNCESYIVTKGYDGLWAVWRNNYIGSASWWISALLPAKLVRRLLFVFVI